MKTKEKLNKMIAVALLPSILFPSCSGYFLDKSVVEINETLATRSGEDGLLTEVELMGTPVAVNLSLNDDDRDYLEFLNRLAAGIVENPAVANQFVADPAKYISDAGLDGLEINMDDGLMNLVLALSDKHIIYAIQHNDISTFISLCKNQGLIDELEYSDLSRIQQILEKNPNLDEEGFFTSVIAFYFAAIVAVVGFVWAAVVTHAGLANALGIGVVAMLAHATFWTSKFDTGGGESPTGTMEGVVPGNKFRPIERVWVLKGDVEKTYVLQSELEVVQTNEYLNALKREFPERMENVDMEKLKQVIMLNL